MNYDKNNIFAKILRKEIPSKIIFENEHVLSFYDVNPQRKNPRTDNTKGRLY